MSSLLFPITPELTASFDGVWEYWRPPDSNVVELGTVRGRYVALPVHFHEEDQITYVLSGVRRFIIGNKPVDVPPGHGLRIPAGTPHQSLSEPSGVLCINIYTFPDAYKAGDLLSTLEHLRQRQAPVRRSDLDALAEERRISADIPAGCSPREGFPGDLRGTVGQAAEIAGMSREGFSRRFKRLHGIPPHTSRLLAQLNDARRLLRSGEPIAEVAAETGFADQSHLGRNFRRFFGITPGRYRMG